ncbi:MAG: ATP/GTP-binding protein, partial [Candidatus Methanomethylophilaceae archaeon]
MLQSFSVANYGSFKDKADFTMEATFDKEHPENVMHADGTDELLLSSALIYGPNGAGKSSLVDAMASLKRMVSEPYPAGYKYGWYHPFALSEESSSSPVSMCIELIVNGVQYTYSISFTEDSVVSESLFHNPNGRRAKVFERDGPTSYSKARKAMVDFTTTSSSYLSVAARFNDPDCAVVYRAITDMIVVQDISAL